MDGSVVSPRQNDFIPKHKISRLTDIKESYIFNIFLLDDRRIEIIGLERHSIEK